MKYLLHGVAMRRSYLVDVGELVPVTAVNARDAYSMARGLATPLHAMAAQQPCPPMPPMVYQIDAEGELIAVFD
jgi:hypothetical protein